MQRRNFLLAAAGLLTLTLSAHAADKPIKVVSDGKFLGVVGRSEILAVIGRVDEGGA